MKMPKRLLVLLVCALAFLNFASVSSSDRVSRPGQYAGYSAPIYTEWVRSSLYVPARDGTKLALDIYRPAVSGVAVDTPYPVILNNTRYHREMAALFFQHMFGVNGGIFEMIRYGYVLAILDARGTGSSYGSRVDFFSDQENEDTYDVIEWLGRQPWSNGKVGMFGLSYMGITQYFAASKAPPSLKAIMPMMPVYDQYTNFSPGGVFQGSFPEVWGKTTQILDLMTAPVSFLLPATPVDEDTNGSMLAAAITQHYGNVWMENILRPNEPFRDSLNPILGTRVWIDRSPYTYRDAIKASGIPVYHVSGWLDIGPKEVALAFNDLGDHPQKMLLGPWYHDQMFEHPEPGEFLKVEHLRWYDYWLKGIENGIMDEPPIAYYTVDAPAGTEWRAASAWPLPKQNPTPFYIHGGPTGTVGSANDGVLKKQAAPAGHFAGRDDYTVDYSYSFGPINRWSNAYGMTPLTGYGDMRDRDAKGLTYTTDPLLEDVEVTGHPVAHLWVNSTVDDGDFFVVLEEVDANGVSHYLTEGVLKASHRAVRPNALYDKLGLPYHRSFAEDYAKLTGQPVELVIDLLPISKVFKKGNRIRVVVVCAEKETYITPEVSPAPTVTVYRDKEHASYIDLPLVKANLAAE